MRPTTESLNLVAERLHPGATITVLTGAGISAASGVPTFRGDDGLWKSFRPEQLATPRAFASDPALVWEWYDWRRQLIARCRPNRGHVVLADWTTRFPLFTLITQNVDGLLERAGARSLIRMHGSIWEMRCWSGCSLPPPVWVDETVPLRPLPPRCPHCGGLARPAVIWFGEALDRATIVRCMDATECDLFLTIGTSAVVYPAASLLEHARARGACTVEINVEPTPASDVVDVAIHGPAEVMLDELHRRLADPH
jgi:NAD-dependent deacetylase